MTIPMTRVVLSSIVLVVACFLALVSSAPAHAQLIPDVCKIYIAGKPEIPRSVAVLMQEGRDSVAEACLDGQILHTYSRVSAVFLGSFNVCSFFKYARRRFDDAGHEVGRYQDSQMFRAVAGPSCPTQDDPRYIVGGSVSEGAFAQLRAFADQLASSPQAFDDAVAADVLPYCGRDAGSGSGQQLREREYQTLRRGIPTTDFRSRFRLLQIGLDPGAQVFPSGYILRRCSGYMLSFSNPLNPNESWHLYVELTPTGFKIIGFAKFIA